MRHALVLLLMFGTIGATAVPAEPPAEVRRLFHHNGAVRLEAETRDGVFHGVYRTWYSNGEPYEVRHYVNGREEGLQQSWSEDGVLFLNYEMRNGRRYGMVNARPCEPADRKAQ